MVDAQILPDGLRQLQQEQARELEEIDSLIAQTHAEIERLLPEKSEVTRKLRELDSGLEQFSQTDIRRVYSLAQETNMRLFMMQSRLEQLEYKKKVLQRTLTVFDQLAAAATNLTPVEPAPPETVLVAGPEVWRAIVAAREGERRALASQLQEFSAQILSSLVLRAQICERAVEVDQARARDELRLLREALVSKLQSTRLLIFELHPQVLEELGLIPTLRRYLQLLERTLAGSSERPPAEGSGTSSPTIDLKLVGLERRYPRPVENGAYRILQEAIRNARQHAQASRISVTVEDEGTALEAMVIDDGRGFEAKQALSQARKLAHSGLAKMHAEAEALGATLQIESAPGQGTRVTLTVPL